MLAEAAAQTKADKLAELTARILAEKGNETVLKKESRMVRLV